MTASVVGTHITTLEHTAHELGYHISTKAKADGSVTVTLERGGLVYNKLVFEGTHKPAPRGYVMTYTQSYAKALESAVNKAQEHADRHH